MEWNKGIMRGLSLSFPSWARWTVTLLFLTFVNWMMFAPSEAFRGIHLFFAHQDKIAHIGLFFILTLLVQWSLSVERLGSWLRIVALVVLVIYPGLLEIFQPLLAKAGRMFEWLDLVSNYAGVSAGWLLFWKLAKSMEKASERVLRQDEQ